MHVRQFWIDVGGTFTDCIGKTPDGRLLRCKLLSSGVTKGAVGPRSDRTRIVDPTRRADPDIGRREQRLRLRQAGSDTGFIDRRGRNAGVSGGHLTAYGRCLVMVRHIVSLSILPALLIAGRREAPAAEPEVSLVALANWSCLFGGRRTELGSRPLSHRRGDSSYARQEARRTRLAGMGVHDRHEGRDRGADSRYGRDRSLLLHECLNHK